MSVDLAIDGTVARLMISRPDKRNAFSQAMWDQFPGLLETAVNDANVRVIILQSATPGMFCAGADIAELLAHKDDAGWRAANQAAINRVQYDLARVPKPVVAFIDGPCVGGGCGLALACDIRVATPRARFGITPAKLGLVYPLHDTKLLVDLVGPGQAKRLLYTGEIVDAAEAVRIGLIERIADGVDDLVEIIAANSPFSCRETKACVRRIVDGQTDDDAATLAIFADAFTRADFAEGTAAFMAKRKPEFRG